MTCIGVDGSKAGWIAVSRDRDGLAFAVYARPRELIAAHEAAAVIAVDIPIGLSEHGARAPDREARRFVGRRRASSVFPAPVRGVLDATTHAEASDRHRRIDGRGLSAQAFGILPKIRDWDAALRQDAAARARVFEIHPEVSFAALNGGAGLGAAKKSAEGGVQRRALLGAVFGDAAVAGLLAAVPRRLAASDDALDALAALWSAERIASGIARSLPSPPPVDAQGWAIAIWY